jgi:holo-[acyl-carrier protein] synthase
VIVGLGVDICDIEKLKRPLKSNKRFIQRVFSKREIEYCKARKNSILHFAGRFAVKEAFIKAVSTDKAIDLSKIETVNNADGKPDIMMNSRIRAMIQKKGAKKIHVTISHVDSISVAVCILER